MPRTSRNRAQEKLTWAFNELGDSVNNRRLVLESLAVRDTWAADKLAFFLQKLAFLMNFVTSIV